jgi:cell division protein FtsI/penicillin-binding protein 2
MRAVLVAVAVLAFAVGVLTATGPGRAEQDLVTRYVRAWARRDYAGMYARFDAGSRRRLSAGQFADALRGAAATATLRSLTLVSVGARSGGVIPVRMLVGTRAFGLLHEVLLVPLSGRGDSAKVHYSRSLLFPGLRAGEHLRRRVSLAPRGDLLAGDGTPLAQGPNRTSPIPSVAGQIVGTLGPIPPDKASAYATLGYPPRAKVGLNGLERVFQDRLAGTPGGRLLAGARPLAQVAPTPGATVTTTIRPSLERAAVAALGGRFGGIAVMDPRTGGLLALAGVAFSALQPPGSTMKIITATGAIEAGLVKLSDTFPIRTSATLSGVTLQNANGEACGGTFLNAFAVSCNSVFAPLGARLGAARLVDIAQRFGFNQAPTIPGAAEPTIPSAREIGDDLAIGSSAIGQGKVQSTALGMADAGATIAMGGRRPIPTLLAHASPQFVSVTSRRVARLVERLMIAVVQFGTGTAAQIPGVTVAGKTGTAELRNTTTAGGANGGSAKDTDAWFVGYAPAGRPRIVVGALFPAQGAGGATAAPAVHDVLVAGLHGR